MDNRVEVHEFLTSRRAKITPDQAGLPALVLGAQFREPVTLLASWAATTSDTSPATSDRQSTAASSPHERQVAERANPRFRRSADTVG
ncbi:hypothetical protein GCM10022225_65290 [Plantactinospora mayteni]|uniref:Uncharacterized protein n=1 Tax=Plantactinospora mayteni TaxID=566021 RepID=A0ABQ4F0K7_9ACTN|nr:hypothetical protein [Plantactinospora mayteni]GIH00400.1 hypothetical protein Pma05_69720 [Plantactinospora mayteni]